MAFAGLLTGALLALGLLGRELDRSLARRPGGAPARPPTILIWALAAAFATLVAVRLAGYL